MQAPEYSKFTRIIFDTAPTVLFPPLLSNKQLSLHELAGIDAVANHFVLTFHVFFQGHTLRLLSLPDFLDASIGKILKVRISIQQ